MKKGVAVDTVILIILGVIVLGLVGYLLYNRFHAVPLNLEDCRVMVLTQYCPYVISGISHDQTYTDLKFNDFCNDAKKCEGCKSCISYATQLGVYDKTSVEAICNTKFPIAA